MQKGRWRKPPAFLFALLVVFSGFNNAGETHAFGRIPKIMNSNQGVFTELLHNGSCRNKQVRVFHTFHRVFHKAPRCLCPLARHPVENTGAFPRTLSITRNRFVYIIPHYRILQAPFCYRKWVWFCNFGSVQCRFSEISCWISAKNASSVCAPRSPSRARTATVRSSASRSPTTSIYGIFSICASRMR